jgi:hypothetical protein
MSLGSQLGLVLLAGGVVISKVWACSLSGAAVVVSEPLQIVTVIVEV